MSHITFVSTLKDEVKQCETNLYKEDNVRLLKSKRKKNHVSQSMFENLIWNGICRWAVEPSPSVRKENDKSARNRRFHNCNAISRKFDFEPSLFYESHSISFQALVMHISYELTSISYRHFILFTFFSICVQHVYTSTMQFKVTHGNVQQSNMA